MYGLPYPNRLSLNVMTIKIDSPGVYTAQGVAIKVTGVAQVRTAFFIVCMCMYVSNIFYFFVTIYVNSVQ